MFKKFWIYLLSFILLSPMVIFIAKLNSNKEDEVVTKNFAEGQEGSSNVNDFMWGGKSLQYFIYKHSNIKENEDANKLLREFKSRSLDIYKNNEDDYFYMSLISSVINISAYGMSSYQEFFAEAYSKWTTTEDTAKNKSWEILNEYFLKIYNNIKNEYSGVINDTNWNNIKALIDQSTISSNISYDTKKTKSENDLSYKDLLYKSENFGLRSIGENDSIKYCQNALLASAQYYIGNGSNDTNYGATSSYLIDNEVKKFFGIFSYNSLGTIMNDSFTKASDKSIQEFKTFKKENVMFESFDKMNDYYLKATNNDSYSNNKYKLNPGANIALSDSIERLGKFYNWSTEKVEDFKSQTLDLFNISIKLSKYGDEYYLLYYLWGFIISRDFPLEGAGESTMAYTLTKFWVDNSKKLALSSSNAFLIFSSKSMNMYYSSSLNDQYQKGWWSSPNIFCTLNHEMGHVMDGYLGSTKYYSEINKSNFSNYIKQNPNNKTYDGDILGYAGDQTYNKSNLFMIIGITVGCVVGSLLIAQLIRTLVSKKPKSE